MSIDESINPAEKKESADQEQHTEQKNWKRKNSRFSPRLPKEKNTGTVNKTVRNNSKPLPAARLERSGSTKAYPIRDKKTIHAKRSYSNETSLLHEVSNHELEQAKQLNQLPAIEAVRVLKFPGLKVSQAKSELIQQIRTHVDKCSYDKLILSISGGLDSALTAGLTAEAIGRGRLQLIHFLESDKVLLEKARAELIAKSLGINLDIRDCRPQVELHCKTFNSADPVTRERLLCRERMISIMTTAEQTNSMVITGINKTKGMLGYPTVYGDLIGELNPIGDLYRTQVIELARAINVPRLIIDHALLKALLPGMSSKDEFQVNWVEADFYLYQMLDARLSLAHIMTLGVDEQKVKYLYQRMRDSRHQRQLAAIPAMIQAYDAVGGDNL